MSDESLAEKVNRETPWWAGFPVIAASIIAVPSFIAIMAGWYIAQHVSSALKELVQLNQTQIQLATEHITFTKRNYDIMVKFIDDNLRCQYVTCLNSAHTPEQRKDCISPVVREREYGLTPPRSPSNDPPNP